jgi:hypothetical protein
MTSATKILIIEDEYVDYCDIFENLKNYQCHPRNEDEFREFLVHIRSRIVGRNRAQVEEAEKYFKDYFNGINFDAIILDIKLGPEKNDISGLEFLSFLRGRFYKLTPIILLSMLPPNIVKSGLTSSSGMANYYLQKGGLEGRLSKTFFENEVKPVLEMLINWYRMTTPENIIKFIGKTYFEEIINYFGEKFEILQTKIDILNSQENELKEFVKVNLSIVRYIAKNQKRSAGRFADKLIEEFKLSEDVPNIEKFRKPIIEALNKGYKEIIKAIKEEGEKELIDYLKDLVREAMGLKENDKIMIEILIVLCQTIKKNIKSILL